MSTIRDRLAQVVRRLDVSDRFDRLASGRAFTWLCLSLLVAGMGLFAAVSLHYGQENTYDLRNYHYYVPYAFLNHRIQVDYAAAQLQSYLNPTPYLPFYLLVTHVPPRVVGAVLGAVHGLLLGLLFLLAWNLFAAMSNTARLAIALLCAGLGVYAPVFLGFVGSSYTDIPLGLMVLSSLLLLVRGLRQPADLSGPRRWAPFLTGGCVFGLATGCKLTLGMWVPGVMLGLLAASPTWPLRLGRPAVFALAAAGGILITSGHWMLVLWSKFGNPVFPLFNALFKSPYYPSANFADKRFLPQSTLDALTYPFHLMMSTHFAAKSLELRDLRYAIVYVLLLAYGVLLLIRWIRRRRGHVPDPRLALGPAARFALVAFVVSFVLWERQFSIIRYAFTLEALAPLVVVVLIWGIVPWTWLRALILVYAAGAMILFMRPAHTERLPWGERFFEVTVPEFREPEKVLVLIMRNYPWSYLFPSFQPEVRFVGLLTNLSKPWEKTRYQEEVRQLVATHEGPMFLLTHQPGAVADLGLLRQHYDMENDGMTCEKIISRHDIRGAVLCPVRRIAKETNVE